MAFLFKCQNFMLANIPIFFDFRVFFLAFPKGLASFLYVNEEVMPRIPRS